MLTREENILLTQVGRGTPCGELLRRYWHPVAAAAELTDKKPIRAVKILGEELVVYRDYFLPALSRASSTPGA